MFRSTLFVFDCIYITVTYNQTNRTRLFGIADHCSAPKTILFIYLSFRSANFTLKTLRFLNYIKTDFYYTQHTIFTIFWARALSKITLKNSSSTKKISSFLLQLSYPPSIHNLLIIKILTIKSYLFVLTYTCYNNLNNKIDTSITIITNYLWSRPL